MDPSSGVTGYRAINCESQEIEVKDQGASADVQGGEGDRRARFAHLIFPHLSGAYALARSLTRNHVDAEDVVQEACLRAFRAIESVAAENARAWLLTIVYNTGCTWLGRNRSKIIVAVEDLELIERSQSREQDTPTPETALIAKVDGKCLDAAIAALPLAHKTTLLLREVEGLDYRQIAEITGVPIGTVMSRLARARRRVITMLEQQAPCSTRRSRAASAARTSQPKW